jgi:hypothetical protein
MSADLAFALIIFTLGNVLVIPLLALSGLLVVALLLKRVQL